MVVGITPPTTLVAIVNVAEVVPAGTVTLDGTVAGSAPDSATIAPPAGAGAVSVAVPVTETPPTTADALTAIDASAGAAVTVTVVD